MTNGNAPRAAGDSAPPARSALSASSANHMGSRDSQFLRIVADKKPHEAAWGTKGSAWDDVALALNEATGTNWNGLAARARLADLLDKFDRFRVGKGTGAGIKRLDADVVPLLEELLLSVAKARRQDRKIAKQKAAVATEAVMKAKEEKRLAAEKAREAKQLALMKERDEKRAAAVVAAAAAARSREGVINTATVVAKRRRRKGVKTMEQKRASNAAIMFDALRQSREEYLNQLRVQTAAEAAAQAMGESKSSTNAKQATKSTADLDLVLLRQVAKVSPFSQETKDKTEQAWVTVAERVLKHCNLKFPPTAIRDRCEALIGDFEANDCKKSTFSSGVLLTDEERLSLLRVIRKAHHRFVKESLEREEGKRRVNSQDAAIEIEDEQTEENDELDNEEIEEWGSLEENQIEESSPDEHVEESQFDDEEKAQQPRESGSAKRLVAPGSSVQGLQARKRRSNDSETSPDADPAAGIDIEELNLDGDSQGSSQSLDFTPRKYKERRLNQHDDIEEVVGCSEDTVDIPAQNGAVKSSVELSAVVGLIQAEQRERRSEFKAMLELMKQQNADRRNEFEREHARRILEQDQRKAEMTSLMDMLKKERKDRKAEVAAMLAAMAKEREDHRAEWRGLIELVTKNAGTPRS